MEDSGWPGQQHVRESWILSAVGMEAIKVDIKASNSICLSNKTLETAVEFMKENKPTICFY